jgi:hypothetical protein
VVDLLNPPTLTSVLALLVSSVGCGGTKPSPPHSEQAAVPPPPWIAEAEVGSEAFLRNRCMEIAPLEHVDPDDAVFQECSRRARLAVERGWATAFRDAEVTCASTGLECCVPVTPDAPSPEADAYRRRLEKCNADCQTRLGRAPIPNTTCNPRSVWARPPSAIDRFRTERVDGITETCADNPGALRLCEKLTTWGERLQCKADCEETMESARYMKAIQDCVHSGATADQAICHFKSPIAEPLKTEAGCTADCRNRLLARARRAVE